MTSRRTLALSVAVCSLAAGLSACRGSGYRSAPSYAGSSYPYRAPTFASGSGGGSPGAASGERMLSGLPWKPDVMRVDLGADGPVALTGLYLMETDLLCVDTTGRLVCLARRDLSARWVSTLKHPVAFAPCDSPTHYVFVERDNQGAYWLEAFSRRTGAPSDGSPIRLPFSASSGPAATLTTAYVGSLGSPRDNKTFESINLSDGSIGWGFRGMLFLERRDHCSTLPAPRRTSSPRSATSCAPRLPQFACSPRPSSGRATMRPRPKSAFAKLPASPIGCRGSLSACSTGAEWKQVASSTP